MNRFERTRQDHSLETAEDYVELVDRLIKENGKARAVDMAERLGVSQVTVGKTIKRLEREGFVTSEPYKSVFLTAKGKKLAEESARRHKTVLEFLLALGVPAKSAEVDAEGIEHHVSEDTLQAMKKFVAAQRS